MGKILVFLQQSDQGVLAKSGLSALRAAQEIQTQWKKESILGVLLGAGAKVAAEAALEYGMEEVFYSENSSYERYVAGKYSDAVIEIARMNQCDTIVGVSSSTGKDMLPLVALAFEAGQASDIVAVNQDGSLKRPMYAGDVLADVKVLTDTKVVTVRASAFAPAETTQRVGKAAEYTGGGKEHGHSEVLRYEMSVAERPELGDASVVVSGGRALQSAENFEKYLFPLADALHAAVGASRAAVDSGYAPNDWQVGQTGKVVAPNLYIAVGISGAIQHLAGMKDSKVIVAINKDADAPIFEIATYGLVGDLYEILPKLTEAIQKIRA